MDEPNTPVGTEINASIPHRFRMVMPSPPLHGQLCFQDNPHPGTGVTKVKTRVRVTHLLVPWLKKERESTNSTNDNVAFELKAATTRARNIAGTSYTLVLYRG